MKLLEKITGILALPILILNTVGPTIGAIWLAFNGEWRLIGVGIVSGVLSIWILPIFMLPVLAFAPLVVRLHERGRFLLYPIQFFANLYINLLIAVHCAFAFTFCIGFHDGGPNFEIIPYLLWAWGIGCGPWQIMSSKGNENAFEAISLFAVCTCYMLFFITLFIGGIFPGIAVLISAFILLFVVPLFSVWLGTKID